MSNIVRQLSRFYNIDIVLAPELKAVKFSGKLDLRDDLTSELKILAASHPIQYTYKNNQIIINPKP